MSRGSPHPQRRLVRGRPKLIEVAAEFGAGYVCTHTGGREPRATPIRPDYPDVVDTVLAETTRLAELAEAAGVPRQAILIDGTGFGKNTRITSLSYTTSRTSWTLAGQC